MPEKISVMKVPGINLRRFASGGRIRAEREWQVNEKRIVLWPYDVGLRPFGLILALHSHALVKVMVVGACLLLASGCVCFRPTRPILYKPNGDISSVLALNLPKHIDTLSAVPRGKVVVENGTNKLTGAAHRSADIKEWFYRNSGLTEYQFILFFNEDGATRWYETEKQRRDPPVFRETTANGCSGALYYKEQPRADPEGGSGGMGYYLSRADFRLHNVYIRVVTRDNKLQSDSLTKAVNELAEMLR